jgi:hypothetical protein
MVGLELGVKDLAKAGADSIRIVADSAKIVVVLVKGVVDLEEAGKAGGVVDLGVDKIPRNAKMKGMSVMRR